MRCNAFAFCAFKKHAMECNAIVSFTRIFRGVFKHRFSYYHFHRIHGNFIEVTGSDEVNMIFRELIENVEQMKLKNQKQSDIILLLLILFYLTHPLYMVLRSNIIFTQYSHTHT